MSNADLKCQIVNRSMIDIMRILAVIGDHDSQMIIRLPEQHRHWSKPAYSRLPSISNTIKNFVDRSLLKSNPYNIAYSKLSIDDELANEYVKIPRYIADRLFVKCDIAEASKILVFRNSRFKFVKFNDIIDSDEIIAGYRLIQNDDVVLVGRHPVKNSNCVVCKKVVIVDKESKVVYLNNETIEDLEGDADGDSVFIIGFSKHFAEDIGLEVEYSKGKDVSIEIPKVDDVLPDDRYRPSNLSDVLNIESPIKFVQTIAVAIGEFEVPREIVQQSIKNESISELLKFCFAVPILSKAVENKDRYGIDLAKERVPNIGIDFDKIIDDSFEYKNLDYSNEIETSKRLEMFARMYFRSYGPKLSGYVQKVLLDISDCFEIVDDKLVVCGNVIDVDERYRNYEIIDMLKVIDRIQQYVIDLKHSYNDFRNLDVAYKLQHSLNRKSLSLNPDELESLFVEITNDEVIAKMTTYAIMLSYLNRHEYLTWSYGLASKLRDHSLRRSSWIIKPVIRLFEKKIDRGEENE